MGEGEGVSVASRLGNVSLSVWQQLSQLGSCGSSGEQCYLGQSKEATFCLRTSPALGPSWGSLCEKLPR